MERMRDFPLVCNGLADVPHQRVGHDLVWRRTEGRRAFGWTHDVHGLLWQSIASEGEQRMPREAAGHRSSICVACGTALVPDVLADTFRCPQCRFMSSCLPIRINAAEAIDEDVRERALRPIRMANFRELLDACSDLLPAGTRLLDVGCAHGWFLQATAERGIVGTGLEPDRAMLGRARANGVDVQEGYFPDALPPGVQFQAITFNDVFEHLPDPAGMARAVRSALLPGGIVIVNLPVSEGLVFRSARLFARLGMAGPLSRMWQAGLPSPHISYFNATALEKLFVQAGLEPVRRGSLASIVTDGLYDRIRYDRSVGGGKAAVLYATALAARAVVGFFPSDIQYFVFRRGF